MMIEHITDRTALYTGKVEVSLRHGSDTYQTVVNKNSGTMDLFKFILSCLRGENRVADSPAFIKLYKDTAYSQPIVSWAILYDDVTTPTEDEEGASITFSFLIPETVVQNQTIRSVQLLDKTAQNVYAQTTIQDIQITDVKTNVAIKWTLSIA